MPASERTIALAGKRITPMEEQGGCRPCARSQRERQRRGIAGDSRGKRKMRERAAGGGHPQVMGSPGSLGRTPPARLDTPQRLPGIVRAMQIGMIGLGKMGANMT